MTREAPFESACALLEAALKGPFRQEILSDVAPSADLGRALLRLRDRMQSHVWQANGRQVNLAGIIRAYDTRTRHEGLHVLHDWDGTADRFNDNSIPVDVLNYLIDQRGAEPVDGATLAILLDYYFLYVLALLSLRIWDTGDADANLDRLNDLLRDLQAPNGSGQRFADNAETLILIATSHYEPHEQGYDRLLEKVRTLNHVHQTRVALGHAPSMGSHLRFGFEATYARDTVVMRNDNVADYPWLCFALSALMRAYSEMHDADIRGTERDTLVEAMVNGLCPDARAFVGEPPASLSAFEVERSQFRERFHRYRQDLLEEFERHRPSDQAYSPFSFFFNFSHNVLKGTIVDALLRGEPWRLTLNDLLTGVPREEAKAASRETLAITLMGYARSSPDRIRGRLMPVIVYDPGSGRQAFALAMRKLRECSAAPDNRP